MKIYRSLDDLPSGMSTAVTVGTFDGVHLGHQKILNFLMQLAKEHQYTGTILTFDPHPRKVVGKGGAVQTITSLEEKLEIFRSQKIDQVVVIPFTKEFAQLTYDQFTRDILINRLGVREMVVGHDHHFGKDREGGYEKLQEMGKNLGFRVHQVPPFKLNDEIINSTQIRNFIQEGNVGKATMFLGRPYTLQGQVIKGDGRGQTIGYPTANLEITDSDKIIPARGVYAVDVLFENSQYKGMMNIGLRPTFNFDALTLEVHIFNFNFQICGKILEVRFKKFLREEKKFSGPDELKKQLEIDKEMSINL